jgi:hypothetical protein
VYDGVGSSTDFEALPGSSEYVGLLTNEYVVSLGNCWYDRDDFSTGFVTVSGKSE